MEHQEHQKHRLTSRKELAEATTKTTQRAFQVFIGRGLGQVDVVDNSCDRWELWRHSKIIFNVEQFDERFVDIRLVNLGSNQEPYENIFKDFNKN